jgi:hypothetical protein
MHGQQNGTIHEEITLGRSDVALVGPLAEDSADVLKRCVHG